MTTIRVVCTDQVLTYENTPMIASGGLEENFVLFSFCNQWDGFEKTAVFWRSEAEAYHNLLDESNSCQLPPEVTADDGIIYLGVFGVDVNGRQRTSNVLTYRIVKGAITTDTKPSNPTPDIYTQLLTQYADIVSMYALKSDKVTNAVNGNFAGLDAEGNLTDSGKCPTSFIDMSVGENEPLDGPVLWFNTSGFNTNLVETVLLGLDEDEGADMVSAEVNGEEYGVNNATVNTMPAKAGIYDFNIQE